MCAVMYWEIVPISEENKAYRVEFFGDEVERIVQLDTLTGEILAICQHMLIFPASHYVIAPEKMAGAIRRIEDELDEQVAFFRSQDKLLEAQRIAQRT